MCDFGVMGNKILRVFTAIKVCIALVLVCLVSAACAGFLDSRKVLISEFQEERVAVQSDKARTPISSGDVQTVSINRTESPTTEGDLYPGEAEFIFEDDEYSWGALIPESYVSLLNERNKKGCLEEHEALTDDNSAVVFEQEVEYDIPVVINRRVMYFVHYFQTTMKEVFSLWLSRSQRYIPMMKEILRNNNLPEDLVYLALIESGFNPIAYSRAHACGPWQFIKETGQKYGMKVGWWIDERRDPEKSTVAAARYLKDLYGRFGSWYLAAAAYNAGENKIVNAIDKHNTEDFWEMSEYRYLKKETRNYIPKLIAAILIAKNPEKYGFHELEYEPPLVYDKVKVPDATDLKVIATASETDYQIIQELNPELRRGCTPPSYPGYEVKIPYGKKEIFEKNFAKIPHDQRFTFARHVIRGGETISGIARLYNTQVQPILQLNKIRNPRSVRAGTSLIIPVRSAKVVKRNIGNKVGLTEVPKKRYLHLEREEIIYTVKKGDTLWDIAQRHEVSTSEIRDWNNLSKNDLIYPGNMLKLRIKRDLSS